VQKWGEKMSLKRRFIFIIIIFAVFPIIITLFNKIYITNVLFNELTEYTTTTIDDFGFEMVNKIYPTTLNVLYEQKNVLKNFSKKILENQRVIDYAKFGLLNTLNLYINELLKSSDVGGVRIDIDNEKSIKIGDFPDIKNIEEGIFEGEKNFYIISGFKNKNVSVYASKKMDRLFLDSLNLSSVSIISVIGKKHRIFQNENFYKDFKLEEDFIISGKTKYPSKIINIPNDIKIILSFDISQLSNIQNKIKDIFFENISSNLNTSIIIWLSLFPLLIYFALFYFGKDIGTLELSIKTISDIAKGDFDVKIESKNLENNRYEELVKSINLLSTNLKNMKKEL
jgi:hypothetical protein